MLRAEAEKGKCAVTIEKDKKFDTLQSEMRERLVEIQHLKTKFLFFMYSSLCFGRFLILFTHLLLFSTFYHYLLLLSLLLYAKGGRSLIYCYGWSHLDWVACSIFHYLGKYIVLLL